LPGADAATGVAPERLGLLGGTFDPPHIGHIAAAQSCRDSLALDRLLLVVANHPWQKTGSRIITPAEDRYAMVSAAVQGVDGVEASRIEIDRGGPSYTIETVETLRAQAGEAGRPMPEISLVVGADLVDSLDTWRRWRELSELVTLVVVSRPQSPDPIAAPGWRLQTVTGLAIDVSSSQVRELLEAGAPVDGLVPEGVIRCIERRNLYATK
jgi:nicotinate-nucleotide adenylyltransferase